MDEALRQIREVAAKDEDARRKALSSLRKLAFSLENVYDTVDRVGHLVRCIPKLSSYYLPATDYVQSLQTGVVQSGIELGLFRYLAEAREPLTVDQVTEQTGAERQTIGTMRDLPEILVPNQTNGRLTSEQFGV